MKQSPKLFYFKTQMKGPLRNLEANGKNESRERETELQDPPRFYFKHFLEFKLFLAKCILYKETAKLIIYMLDFQCRYRLFKGWQKADQVQFKLKRTLV